MLADRRLDGFVQDNWKGLGSYGTLGLEIVLGVILPSYVGILADRRWDTGRLWLSVGFALGVAHGVRAVYRAIRRANEEADAHEQELRRQRQQYHDESNKKHRDS